MREINNAVRLSAESLQKIDAAKAKPDFNHRNWSDPELESVRCEIRDFYRNEQRLTCAYCRNPISSRSASGAHVEHIAPKAIYPQFMFEPLNLCVICPDCNEYKRNRETLADKAIRRDPRRKYPISRDSFRLYHPHFDLYEANIIKAGHLYIERSPEGGYTIYVCNLNRFTQAFGMSEELLKDFETLAQSDRFHRS